jgi:hypothetical protein
MATSSSKKLGIKGKVIHSQGREIISNILNFMKQETANGTTIIPLANFKARLIAATKISESSYRRIAKEPADVASGAVPCFSNSADCQHGLSEQQRPRNSRNREYKFMLITILKEN